MTERMCQYGDCENTDTPILVSDAKGGYRVRFCCWEHAGLYALKHAERAPVRLGKWTLTHDSQ